jgi:hypothetical protein
LAFSIIFGEEAVNRPRNCDESGIAKRFRVPNKEIASDACSSYSPAEGIAFSRRPMKTKISLICLALLSIAISSGAKTKPLPDPAGETPSVRLSRFLRANLDAILAPLDRRGLRNERSITEFRDSLAQTSAKLPPAERPPYQTADDVCQALAKAYAEREKSITSDSQRSRWPKRSEELRQQIDRLYIRQRESEQQLTAPPGSVPEPRYIGPAPQPPPPIVNTAPVSPVIFPGTSPAAPSIIDPSSSPLVPRVR